MDRHAIHERLTESRIAWSRRDYSEVNVPAGSPARL
jgi:hypothetical protein